uniref:Uncharacterized protein n=1 Tax=Anguilla anguilla TaxID=7936 RepID=A0A0E9Q053_ANGAN
MCACSAALRCARAAASPFSSCSVRGGEESQRCCLANKKRISIS